MDLTDNQMIRDEAIQEIVNLSHTKEFVEVREIINVLQGRGLGMALFVFALPAAIPLPGLGINFAVAMPLLILTLQQVAGRKTIWLPKIIENKKIRSGSIQSVASSSARYINVMENIVKPRFGFISKGLLYNVSGLGGFLMALSVLVPLPLTNTVPSIGIAVMGLGVAMRDGVAVILGLMIGLLWISALLGISFFIFLGGLGLL